MLLVLDLNFSVKTSNFWSIFICIHVHLDLMLLQLLYFPIIRRQFTVYFRRYRRCSHRVCAFGWSWRRGRQFLGQHLFPSRSLRQSWSFGKNNGKKQNKNQTVPPRTWHDENSRRFFFSFFGRETETVQDFLKSSALHWVFDGFSQETCWAMLEGSQLVC